MLIAGAIFLTMLGAMAFLVIKSAQASSLDFKTSAQPIFPEDYQTSKFYESKSTYLSFEESCVRYYVRNKLRWSIPQGGIREVQVSMWTINHQGEYSKTLFLITDEGKYDVVVRRYKRRRRLRKMLFGLAQKHP